MGAQQRQRPSLLRKSVDPDGLDLNAGVTVKVVAGEPIMKAMMGVSVAKAKTVEDEWERVRARDMS